MHGRLSQFGVPVLLLGMLAGAGSPAAADPIDDAAEFGRRYVEAVNSGDAGIQLGVLREIFTEASLSKPGEAALLGQMNRLAADLGPLEFHHAETSCRRTGTTTRCAMHVFARGTAGWKDLQFWLETTPPHRIDQLFFLADVAEPVLLPPGSITDSYTLEWLNERVDQLREDHDLSGAVLVALGDRPVFERYFGFADAEGTRPCSPETRFNLGSGNKMFTALAVALLVEEGKLRFDTSLEEFFPDLGDRQWRDKVTVGHLLSHTSGVGEYWTPATDEALTRVRTLEAFLPFVREAGIVFAPGSRAEYSNSNFILAGLVVQQVSGMDYFDFIRGRICAPCGMDATDSYPSDGSVANLAEPLTGRPGDWRPARRAPRGSSAGGGYSTTGDILRFSRCLVEERILPASRLGEMTRSHTDSIPGAELDYGYGFIRERSLDNVRSFGHGGIAPGVNFEYRYYPSSDITLVVFSNQDNGAYDSLRKTLDKLITGER